ncbi:hypothetical protein LMG28614_06611 [Paraburkholderia ultramafica]|uniref:Uncharacterized protein YtcA n=1 Tax=Paraburkholderia ultramafica TaxID=1544867 RepID=A0A6S7DHP3_9BURK|nr:YtcA family lipoprotein [Paraburkholderia ultramafica]CAB3807485.1 hypothetical protein LMG28614_06611 [Paraburkholderia ultramafica]
MGDVLNALGCAHWTSRIRGFIIPRAGQFLAMFGSLLLCGRTFAPSIALFGAGFPDWVFCIAGGVAATSVVHVALGRRGVRSWIAPLAVSYPALSASLAMAAWLIIFSH